MTNDGSDWIDTEPDWGVLEKQYLEAAAEEWRLVRTEGEVSELSLTNIYTVLRAIEPTPKPTVQLEEALSSSTGRAADRSEQAKSGRGYNGEAESPRENIYPLVSLAQALKEHDHLVLLGEAGSGKSTLLQFITLYFSRGEEVKAKLDLNEARIPVHISLREHAETIAQQQLEVALASEIMRLTTATDSEAMELVKRWRDAGCLTVLLDGFDEVDEKFRQRLINDIRPYASSRGSASRIVLTSRPEAYLKVGEPFTEYEVRPFEGAENNEHYIADWLVALTGNKSKWGGFSTEELVQRIKSQIRFPDIATNPLLLRLSIEVFVECGEMAKNQAQLFRSYIESVLWEKAVARDLPRESKAAAMEALETIAWTINAREKALKAEMITELTAASAESNVAWMEVERLLELLTEKLGLLRQSASIVVPRVEFRRESYREYFVARRLAKAWLLDQKRTKRFLRPRLHHPRWRGPVMLLAMMLDPVNASHLLRYVLVAKSPYEKQLARDLLLAGDCLRTGVQVDPTLRRDVYCRLASTYRNRVTLFNAQDSSDPVIEPIRQVFATAEEEDRAAVLEILVTLFYASGSSLPLWKRTLSNFVSLIGDSLLLFHFELWKLKRTKRLPNVVELIREWPRSLGETRDHSDVALKRRIIASIGDLRITGQRATQILVNALEDPFLNEEAARALAKVGVGERLITALQRHSSHIGWDNNIAEMVRDLGVLGLRDEQLVEHMIAIVNNPAGETGFRNVHYAVTVALCKASETSVTALDFVLRAWRNFETMSESIREGLRDGSKLRTTPSPEVLLHLLRTVRESEDRRVRGQAWELLSELLRDGPVIQCRIIELDGVINFKVLDVTEEVFSLFLLRPPVDSNELLLGGSSRLFVQWCLRRPEIAIRWLQLIADVDPWLLAAMLEEAVNPTFMKNNSDARKDYETTVARLRSSQKAVRDAELKRWRATEDVFVSQISRTKCQYLHGAYSLAVRRIWGSFEDSVSRAREQPFDPYVVAALTCFRGWNFDHQYVLGLSDTEIRIEFISGIKKALSILQSRDRDALDALSSVLLCEEAELVNTIVQQQVEAREQIYESHWNQRVRSARNRRRPDFIARATSAYAIAKLSDEHPEAERLLLSCLKPEYWKDDRSEFQYHLIISLGSVNNASIKLVQILYDIMTQSLLYGVGRSVIEQLKRPSHEAIVFLIEQYDNAVAWERNSLLNAVGAERPVSKPALELLLRALKDKDADVRDTAAILLSQPALLEKMVQRDEMAEVLADSLNTTPEIAVALAEVIATIQPTGEKKLSFSLRHHARRIAKVIQTFHTLQHTDGSLYEALSIVVGHMTKNKVKSLKDNLLSERATRAEYSLIIDTIVAAILALTTNIIATYLHEQFEVFDNPIRLTIVFAVFFISLIILTFPRHLKNRRVLG